MRRTVLIALLAAWLLPTAQADFGHYLEHVVRDQSLLVRTDMGELRITAVDDAAFEVHYVENGVAQLPSFALADNPAEVAIAVTETESDIGLAIDGLLAVVSKSPVTVSWSSDGEPLLAEEQGYFANDDSRGFRFRLEDDEKILGGGQRVLGMDRRGQRMPLYNKAHYGYETESEQMYYSLPAVMSSRKYMLVFDNSASGWLDIGKTEPGILQFEAVGGRTAYLIVAGDNYPALIENYTDVTGRQPLPPRWAFGNFASRFGYRDENEVRDVVKRFRRQKIPLDTVVLDIFWFGPDIKGHMGNLDWDRNTFPTPEDMIADFRQQGVKTITVTEPFVLSTSKRWQDAVDSRILAKTSDGDPRRFDFYFGNTGLIDLFDERARDWFWQPYNMLFDQGIAGTWGDLGEPEVHPGDAVHWLSDHGIQASGDEVHNAYGHVWTKMVYEKQTVAYPEQRPLIMMRSGFAGTQRYGIVPWTGDVKRSWDGLKPQIELGLQMGLFGLGYTHSDLGGFADGESFDREMYIRWLQYGVFQPVYRPHAQDHIAPEPVFHDRKTRKVVRKFIELRYRLLPYNYTLAFENSTTGMPLMRPFFYENENDPALIDEKNAYFWGDAFLVAPVMDPGLDSVPVDLPAGTWFDFWDDTRYDGKRSVEIPVTLETIPVLVRAGSFVPMTDVVQSTDDYSSEKLELHYYADASVRNSSGTMYEDDGKSRASLDSKQYELLQFDAAQDGRSLSLYLRRDGGNYPGMPESREMTIVVHNWSADVDEVRFGDEALALTRRLPKRAQQAWHDKKNRRLVVRVDWDHGASILAINPRPAEAGKPVVYQVFTRLFGNKRTANKPWGTSDENGVGKFADFTTSALREIRKLGVSHIWYTGVPHHALIADYTSIGISNDDPDVVKGRAGSPYAVKDYYSVNPDLAIEPANRLEEFRQLVERTHNAGMKVIIDIVPNHVARAYQSASPPNGVIDFGANDDTSVEWARDNNFYYIVGEDFSVPQGYVPLNGETHPLADGEFHESPAKWTGNGSRKAQPEIDDWFETVKINFGVRPDGSYDFDRLPEEARNWLPEQHADFWRDRDVPDSWEKFRDVALYWSAFGVDGFRYDMAEMVPVEFWSYLNSSIKAIDPDAFLLAEIYNPSIYRDYIQLGLMSYLYDKVGMYDTIRQVMRGERDASEIIAARNDVADIDRHMLHFLENHDEQRIASEAFAGNANAGKPGMVVSALLGQSPMMIYFAQELGEPGDGDPGFGDPTRTTIFDYWGVPSQQRWMNGGRFDGGKLSDEEKSLRDFYARLLSFSANSAALRGDYAEIHSHNLRRDSAYNDQLFAFARWRDDERLLIVSNFGETATDALSIDVPADIVAAWQLADGRYTLDEQISNTVQGELNVDGGVGRFRLQLEALESAVFRVGESQP